MKLLVFLALAVFVTVESFEYFTTGNDHLDVDLTMSIDPVREGYMDCFLDKGPCDALAQSYKKNFDEAIPTACYRCNVNQKHMWHRFLCILKNQYPEEYAAFQQKYDPGNKYMDAFENAVQGY